MIRTSNQITTDRREVEGRNRQDEALKRAVFRTAARWSDLNIRHVSSKKDDVLPAAGGVLGGLDVVQLFNVFDTKAQEVS